MAEKWTSNGLWLTLPCEGIPDCCIYPGHETNSKRKATEALLIRMISGGKYVGFIPNLTEVTVTKGKATFTFEVVK